LTINEDARLCHLSISGRLVEQPLQLAFTHIDRSAALDERILDLLSTAEAYQPTDNIRALYFANEALMLAESHDFIELELRSLQLIIRSMRIVQRSMDATPYILRAIDLAESIEDAKLRSTLMGALGDWAIEMEQESQADDDHRSSMDWALATIARLEREHISHSEGTPSEATESAHRSDSAIDDPETGLLNALGLAAELLSLEERQIEYAVIRIVFSPDNPALLIAAAQHTAQLVGDRGLVARNDYDVLTAVLPLFTGIAAMATAEHLRAAFTKMVTDSDTTIAIGVAIKQAGESSRDLLRRVTDRAEEAGYQAGVTVAG
jgi:hypothetical protein